jgi:hypothetical protein
MSVAFAPLVRAEKQVNGWSIQLLTKDGSRKVKTQRSSPGRRPLHVLFKVTNMTIRELLQSRACDSFYLALGDGRQVPEQLSQDKCLPLAAGHTSGSFKSTSIFFPRASGHLYNDDSNESVVTFCGYWDQRSV